MSNTEPAVLCEIGPEPQAGKLTKASIAIFHPDLPVPLTVATLHEAATVARARGWTLEPIPPVEDFRPETARDLTDEAWVTVRKLLANR